MSSLRLSISSLFASLALLSACATKAESSATDAGYSWSATCSTPVADFCRTTSCPATWLSARDFAIMQCKNLHPPIPTRNVSFSTCGGSEVLSQGDGYLGRTYYFDVTSGALTAVFADSDQHPNESCVAGPVDFVQPPCTATNRTTCEALLSPVDAGSD